MGLAALIDKSRPLFDNGSMDMFITMLVLPASEFLDEAKQFYQDCNRTTSLNPEDTLVIALANEQVAGIVRLCFENETFVLRTMQIRDDFQRQGLGSMLLDRFDDLIKEKKIENLYCMPHDYLENFYGKIGFQKIRNPEAPEFLQARAEDFSRRNPGKAVILMKKAAKPRST